MQRAMSSAVSRVAFGRVGWVMALALSATPAGAATSARVSVEVVVGEGLTWTTDSDTDGIPDYWEYENFCNTTTVASDSDYDADGVPDIDECRAGTDPKDPDSFLRVAGLRLLPDGRWLIVWDSSTNPVPAPRVYDIAAGSSLAELAQGGAVLETGIVTEGVFTDVELSGMFASQRFFRVTLH